MISRRTVVAGLGALGAQGLPRRAGAQTEFPDRPIALVVPGGPGGVGDVIGRAVAREVAADLGQPMVIENRTGGATIVGSQYVARARPDGYTLLQVTTAGVIAPSLQRSVSFDFQRDFVPVLGLRWFPTALCVSSESGIESVEDIARLAREPAGLAFASYGIGSLAHLGTAELLNRLDVEAVHLPYRGPSEAIQALLANQVQFALPAMTDALRFHRAGALRILAVVSDRRLASLPDVPTLAELGYPEVTARVWYGYLAPAATPPEVAAILHDALAAAIARPAVQRLLTSLSFTGEILEDAEFGAFMAEEEARWREAIAANGVTLAQ